MADGNRRDWSQNTGDWHSRMLGDLVVAGMAQRTQEAYLRAVRTAIGGGVAPQSPGDGRG